MSLEPRSAAANDLLQALTVGDVAPDDPAVAARLANDAALRERWQAIAATLADLGAVRGDLDDLGPGVGSAPDAAAAIRAFRRAASRRRWLAFGAAAAAVLLVAAMVWLLRPARGPAFDPLLGRGDAAVVMTPDGPWPADAPLQWSEVRGAAGYRVEVQGLPDGPVTVWPNTSDGELLPAATWLPTPAQRTALPAHFQWCFVAVDASNQAIYTSRWTTAHR